MRSNSDFRALLSFKKAAVSEPQSAQNKRKRVVTEQPSYRDRAEERRAGVAADNDDADNDNHATKGLDFALLAKQRAQQQRPLVEPPMEAASTPVIDYGPPAMHSIRKVERQQDDAVKSSTALGSRILNVVFSEPPTQNPRMAPGRMYYSFDLTPKVPLLHKSVMRANDAVPQLTYVMSGVEKLVIERASRAVSEWSDASARERKDQSLKERFAAAIAPTNATPHDDDDDIFAGAGSYVPEVNEMPEITESAAVPIGVSVFEDELKAAQLVDERAAAERARADAEADARLLAPDLRDLEDQELVDHGPESDAYPDTDDAYPNTDDAYPTTAPSLVVGNESDSDDRVDDIDAGDEDVDVEEKARKLLEKRGLAVDDDEYGLIGVVHTTLPSGDESDDDDGGEGSKKRKRELSNKTKAAHEQQRQASKFDRNVEQVTALMRQRKK